MFTVSDRAQCCDQINKAKEANLLLLVCRIVNISVLRDNSALSMSYVLVGCVTLNYNITQQRQCFVCVFVFVFVKGVLCRLLVRYLANTTLSVVQVLISAPL